MVRLTFPVRAAALSILLASVFHIFFWAIMAVAARELPDFYPYTLFLPVACVFSTLGLFGIFVGVGLFRVRNWARLAALVLAALAAAFCAFGILVASLILLESTAATLGIELAANSRRYLIGLDLLYLFIFCLALWWIYLFSRRFVAAQFAESQSPASRLTQKKASCPPPIALLAWLMIGSAALCAASWPLILGKIPAMLFTRIYSPAASKWIWTVNIVLFLACGVGLLRLQRWSYTGTIALHVFWLVSLFVSQVSPAYPRYLGLCFAALQADQSATYFIHFALSSFASAFATAIPTALLIAGLFYYRSAFLKAADEPTS